MNLFKRKPNYVIIGYGIEKNKGDLKQIHAFIDIFFVKEWNVEIQKELEERIRETRPYTLSLNFDDITKTVKGFRKFKLI